MRCSLIKVKFFLDIKLHKLIEQQEESWGKLEKQK